MIPDIKKILYTTDLSASAVHAFGYAMSLAHRYDATITIYHVLEQMSESINTQMAAVMGQDRWLELMQRNEIEARATLKDRLARFCREMESAVPECPFRVSEIIIEGGAPVERILAQAEKSDADLVVMGTHGQGILADVMLGSTARRVLRRCQRPVMVIRLPKED